MVELGMFDWFRPSYVPASGGGLCSVGGKGEWKAKGNSGKTDKRLEVCPLSPRSGLVWRGFMKQSQVSITQV